ncbi:MAG: galactose mutarotase [Actinomycetes bacterium]
MQRISNDQISVEVDLQHGGRISSLKWKDFEFVLQRREHPMEWGWFGMVPWAGRINEGRIRDSDGGEHILPTNWDPPHAEHGFGFVSEWEVTGPNSSALVMPEPYFPAIAEQRFEIENNSLTWTLEYLANGTTLPAWVGFHPWFPKHLGDGPEVELIFEAEKMLVRGPNYLPTGEYVPIPPKPWDDAFSGVKNDPILQWPGQAKIRISSEVPWWVVYTEDPMGICVEPQTAPPDAANLDIQGAHRVSATFTFSD